MSTNNAALDEVLGALAKAYAVGTYTSDHCTEHDYDAFMALKSWEDDKDYGFQIWEPFEGYCLSNIQEHMETEFSTAFAFAKKVANVSQKSSKIRTATILVTIDHIESAINEVFYTHEEAKAFVLSYTNHETIESLDAALNDSIDAIDGIINYSIKTVGSVQ